MRRASVYFAGEREVTVRDEPVEELLPHQVLVETDISGISAGTEMLFYRNEIPPGMQADASILALQERFHYPLKYGYAAVGRIVDCGSGVAREWKGRRVFALHPHESHFVASAGEVILLPDGMNPEDAVFLPFIDTAVNFLMDGKPLIGEQVAVFGQGIVGLLSTALLAQFPLSCLVTLDRHDLRREKSRQLGATVSLDPRVPDVERTLSNILSTKNVCRGADLTFELSGDPEALNRAVAATAFSGRVVVGSWYGTKRSAVDFGNWFHRSRIRIISSQVSSLAPEFSGNWTRLRRREVALRLIGKIRPSSLITHRLPVGEAAKAYEMLDRSQNETLQIVFTYH